MKYSALVAALVTFVPSSSWAEKPPHTCESTNKPPYFSLGGYNVPETDYLTGLDMVEALWRKNLLDKYQIEIHPSRVFNPTTGTPLEADDHFDFDTRNGHYRGVGVKGSIDDDEEEVDNNEGIYIYFGGLSLFEVSFGIRALFEEHCLSTTIKEAGLITFYKNGEKIIGNDYSFKTMGNDHDDGQGHFSLVSDVAFDAISFISYSHDSLGDSTYFRDDCHDYFLEYLDICWEPEAKISGDPHIETWSGTKYDFHGVCDLVLLQNPDFQKGLGMNIHVRTKQINQFSYVSSAVLQIGDDTLEVMGDIDESLYWINKQPNGNLEKSISGYPISSQKVNSKQYEFIVDLGDNKSIIFRTFKKFVRVSIQGATEESFGTSIGLLGSYGSGKWIARDNRTVIEDVNAFGQEWQVLPQENMLFHNAEGPQAPEKCKVPQASALRRRLAESTISEEEAESACVHVSSEDFDMCVFDVMATRDKDIVGAY